MKSTTFAFLLLCILHLCSSQPRVNNRPIVGILSQPTDGPLAQFGNSYIAASYVKYVESAGARAVPILYNSTTEQLDVLFDSVNAILFPGGGANLNYTTLYSAGDYLWNKMIEANNNGDYFPLFGHCMGFELIALITSANQQILQPTYGTENVTMPLNFTKTGKDSTWITGAHKDIKKILETEDVCLNNHMWGVYMSTFENNLDLNSFFSVISTNTDSKGTEFISTWEGIKYPVFAMQWHAEKPQFEWNPDEATNHDYDAIISMQYFANFLVQQARMNYHKFDSYNMEYNSLIYNWPAWYTQYLTGDFEQCYIF